MISFSIPDSIVPKTDATFQEVCRNNPTSRVERTKTGEILIMAPTGGQTGNRNFDLYFYFQL